MEDAEALAELLTSHASVEDALKAFDAARRPKAESLQRASNASQGWFEHIDEHIGMPFEQFVFASSPRACASPMPGSRRRRPSWCAASTR